MTTETFESATCAIFGALSTFSEDCYCTEAAGWLSGTISAAGSRLTSYACVMVRCLALLGAIYGAFGSSRAQDGETIACAASIR